MARINLGFPSGRQGLMDDAEYDFVELENADCSDCRWAKCKTDKNGECDYECMLISCEFEEGEPSEDE